MEALIKEGGTENKRLFTCPAPSEPVQAPPPATPIVPAPSRPTLNNIPLNLARGGGGGGGGSVRRSKDDDFDTSDLWKILLPGGAGLFLLLVIIWLLSKYCSRPPDLGDNIAIKPGMYDGPRQVYPSFDEVSK